MPDHTHILLATLGGQPQVVTFTLDLLLNEGFPINEVMVIHPKASQPRLQRSLACLSAEFVGDYYKANLMELNFGQSALTAEAAAYVANTLVQPASVIITHVNEGATVGGKVRPTSRTAALISLVKGPPVYPALSGKTMEFDGAAKCVAGC